MITNGFIFWRIVINVRTNHHAYYTFWFRKTSFNIIRSPRLGLPDELLRALGDGRGSGTSEGDALAAAEEVPLFTETL